jgi:G3E family GTPase
VRQQRRPVFFADLKRAASLSPCCRAGAAQGEAAEVKRFLDGGMNPSIPNSVGQTALHVASMWGRHTCVDALIKGGAQVNVKNFVNGFTPLHCAAQDNERAEDEGRIQAIKLLLAAGADAEAPDQNGRLPVDLTSNAEIRALLTEEPGQDLLKPVKPNIRKTPITLLSGFLGAGKTTLLRVALENKQGLKIAVVVNDVAKVNIDSKLVRERTQRSNSNPDMADCIELQNGCACCNASDELLQGISQLLRLGLARGYFYDRIIIELSGVAEPKNIRAEFEAARTGGHMALLYCELQTLITVVDAPSFTQLYSSRDAMHRRPDLFVEEKGEPEEEAECERKVVDLLVEQMECADFVVLNKKDKCTEDEMSALASIAQHINPTAHVITCEWGKVPLDVVVGGPKGGRSWVQNDDEDDLRHAIQAAKEQVKKRKALSALESASQERANSHARGHGHEGKTSDSDGHGNAHDLAHEHAADVCMSDAHGQGHGHGHGHELAVVGHGHEAVVGHEQAAGGHGHGHSHGDRGATTAETKYGITSFVYSRRRPFHPQRLLQVVLQLPVRVDPNTGDLTDEWKLPNVARSTGAAAEEGGARGDVEASVMRSIIRSKGFVWVANQHLSAQYWSHAGHHFELHPLGLWWAATRLQEWPAGGNKDHADVQAIVNDFASQADPAWKYGDRRQELVFIGMGMKEDKIEALMDQCLLTDDEMRVWQAQVVPKFNADLVAIDVKSASPYSIAAGQASA